MTMATFSTSLEAQQAAVLLEGYRFELGGHDARQWVSLWLEFYRPNWIRDAVVEALYQGRYKSVSVRQILELWHRRGQPIRHVTHDFEAAVCREFGEIKAAPMPAVGSGMGSGMGSGAMTQHSSIRVKASRFSAGENSASDDRAGSGVSFDLSTLPLASPGMAAASEGRLLPPATQAPAPTQREFGLEPVDEPASDRSNKTSRKALDHKAWREFSTYTTPTYASVDAEEALEAQRQFKGVLYSSAKAIQPFKPALPFSAQTLRLAKQKAIASMAESMADAR